MCPLLCLIRPQNTNVIQFSIPVNFVAFPVMEQKHHHSLRISFTFWMYSRRACSCIRVCMPWFDVLVPCLHLLPHYKCGPEFSCHLLTARHPRSRSIACVQGDTFPCISQSTAPHLVHRPVPKSSSLYQTPCFCVGIISQICIWRENNVPGLWCPGEVNDGSHRQKVAYTVVISNSWVLNKHERIGTQTESLKIRQM